MPEPQTVDEVVNARAPSRGLAARPVHEESVNASSGATRIDRSDVEDENHSGATRAGRKFSKSIEDKLAKLDKEDLSARLPAPHEEGDADDEEETQADEDPNPDAA